MGIELIDGEMDFETDPLDPELQKSKELIEEHLTIKQLEEVRKIFETHRFGLKQKDFKLKVLNRYNIKCFDEDLETLFNRINFNKDDAITWDKFISYLALELGNKGKEAIKFSIDNPIVGVPDFIYSHHGNAVINITFSPSVRLDGSIDYEDGKYITMSKDGIINFWGMDLKHLRSFRDKSLNLTIRSTWVTNFVCLPDVNILVTSSTERELRFYDTTSKRFNLILAIVIMPFCVNHMFYQFWESSRDESILVCGDLGGNIRVLEFSKVDKGPFKQKIGVDMIVMKWEDVVKGKLKKMKAYNILNIHGDWVREVSYYRLLGEIVSCSSSSTAMFIGDHRGTKNSYTFVLKRGIETFCLNEDSPSIITGSLDCVLRIWNPFITNKPVSVLRGHHATIIKIFLQDEGNLIYSFDRDRCLRVWENSTQSCIQIYSGFAANPGPAKEICAYYNPNNHLFIVGGSKIASVTCQRLVDQLRSDGRTHSNKVSVVLFNRLFKYVITCGIDSNIVVWDLWTNKTKNCIRMAHSNISMGIRVPVPITAATLDPLHQLMLTGASDGSIKIWDFNTGSCLRHMDIGKGQEVTKLIWIKNRILAVGWQCRVVEFSDSLAGKITVGKAWEQRHTENILAADFRPGQALASSTYNGDLIFWRLETGQSYRRFNISYPTSIFKLEYIRDKEDKKTDLKSITSKSSRGSSRNKKDNVKRWIAEAPGTDKKRIKTFPAIKEIKMPRRVVLAEKEVPHVHRNLAVHCLVFLKSRVTLPDQVTLLTATENGMVQAWSHHPNGGYISAFQAVHINRDYVTSMATDPINEFLFTGTLAGYIKIWLLKNYYLTAGQNPEICMPLYRIQFPFLIKDRLLHRAKAALRYQPLPLLLSSYKGHLNAVMCLDYVPECKIVLSASADSTLRVWTLSGRYLGTLGQEKPWPILKWGEDAETLNPVKNFRIPPDLKRNCSYTSMKVFQGAPPIATKRYIVESDLSITEDERKYGVYGKSLKQPHLGHFHSLPEKTSKMKTIPSVDETMMNIPVFVHLKMAPWEPTPHVPIPKCISLLKKSIISEQSEAETPDDFTDM